MNWSSMEKRVVLLACALAIAGSCCIAACDATPAGNQAQATPEGDGAAVDTRDERRRIDAQEVLSYLQSADFRMGDVRLGAAFGVGAEEAARRDELEVRVSEGGVWVLETCRESAEERARAEGEIAGALVCGLSAPAGECGPLALPWLKATDAVGLKVMEATNGKLTEVRAYMLACSLAGAVLEGDADTDDNPKTDADQESSDASDTTGTSYAWPEVPEGALVVHVPKTPATAEVTWVVVKEGHTGEAADDSNTSKASEMDKTDKNDAEVSGAGAGKQAKRIRMLVRRTVTVLPAGTPPPTRSPVALPTLVAWTSPNAPRAVSLGRGLAQAQAQPRRPSPRSPSAPGSWTSLPGTSAS